MVHAQFFDNVKQPDAPTAEEIEKAFPNILQRWIKALKRVKPAEKGGGLLSENYFRCYAEEFYPDHVEFVVFAMMSFRLQLFMLKDEKLRRESIRVLHDLFRDQGLIPLWGRF